MTERQPPAYLRSGRERAAEGADRPWTVGELTHRIQSLLVGVGRIQVVGEVSRVVRAASGHVYFDLKEGQRSKVACAIWQSRVARALRFDLAEGQEVVVHGALDVYAPRGGYSLIVDRVEQAGVGALLARFEELKQELAERGWFERRRPLPQMARCVGVVTSRDGAALQDFLRTRSLRWPLYPVRLAHAPVQGPGAAAEIADAVKRLDASGVDVLCLVRGGGSIEDLWAFNEVPVLRAIREATVPVVTGVGHETDVTLADYVADHRAHTPTDAAQTVIPDRNVLEAGLERAANHLMTAADGLFERRAERLARLARSRVLRGPGWILDERRAALVRLADRLGRGARSELERSSARVSEALRHLQRHGPALRLERARGRLALAAGALRAVPERIGRPRAERLGLVAARLEAISPLRVLARGYSVTARAGSAEPLLASTDVTVGAEIVTRLARGTLRSEVRAIEPPVPE